MAKVQDFRSDFRKGRTGTALRIRQDVKSYTSSLKEAKNMMVLSDGRIARRWGTEVKEALTGKVRLETWDYSEGNTTQFLLYFSNDQLLIKDLTLTTRATFTSTGWTDSTLPFLSIAYNENTLVITDESITPKIVTLSGTSFSIEDFEFSTTADDTYLNAPFAQMASGDITATLTCLTSKGMSSGYGSYIATALSLSPSDFDLTNGTGKITTSANFFTGTANNWVGNRLQILDGEVEITSVTSQTEANITVKRNIAKKLDVNPFYIRNGSKLVEVSYFNHGLQAGDEVFFAGIADTDSLPTILTHAVKFASDASTAAAPSGGAAAYTIKRIVDADTFEIEGAANGTVTLLTGGADVTIFVKGGIKGIKEPAFSKARGWPTACAIHERRLWLGGSSLLPNAIWASRFSDYKNFNLGEALSTDALALYGIGKQARIRHLVSAYDLLIFTDNEEIYIQGNSFEPITQASARAVTGTEIGASYTTPQKFDGGVFFVDKIGTIIREFASSNRDTEYTSNAASTVISDWVKQPKQTCLYKGSNTFSATPYLFFADSTDGALLCLHASRADDSFGWMRWELSQGSFVSVASINEDLYAIAQRGINYYLLKFDTSTENYMTTDFSAKLTASPAGTNWTTAWSFQQSQTLQIQGDYYDLPDVNIAADGTFTTSQAFEEIVVGDSMQWNMTLHAPKVEFASGSMIGKNQRLVSAEVSWDQAVSGTVAGQNIISTLDIGSDLAVTPVNVWREYHIGLWDREPNLVIEGSKVGRVIVRGLVMNVYL